MSRSEVKRRDLDEAILERRSVRGYLPKQVPRATLEEILSLAQRLQPLGSGGGRNLGPRQQRASLDQGVE